MTLVSLNFVGLLWVASGFSSVLYDHDSNVEVYKSSSSEEIVFSNFIAYLHSRLNVSSMESHSTETAEDCQNLCLHTPHCSSINVAIHSASDNNRQCQLLSTNKERKSEKFRSGNDFNHFTTVATSCFSQPCLRGGSCRQHGTSRNFTCECAPGLQGQFYEISGTGWRKLNIRGPVCIGARRDAFGRTSPQFVGYVTAIKLVHVSGLLYTSRNSPGARWGRGRNHRLGILITNDQNQILKPENYTGSDWYTMAGHTVNSPELVFPNLTTPTIVSTDLELRFWFWEDHNDASEGDNMGESCVDVFMLYV